MNPYEVLGVACNSGPVLIKMKWKKLSSINHPDKNPDSAAKMAEINQAYEILSDPVRRKHYDETAQLQMPPPFDMKVQSEAMAAISFAVNQGSPDVLNATIRTVQAKLNEISAAAQNMRGKRAMLQKQREGVTTTNEQNLFHMVIDQQLADIEQKLKQSAEADDLVSAVYKLLQDYKQDPGLIPPMLRFSPAGVVFSSASTGTSS